MWYKKSADSGDNSTKEMLEECYKELNLCSHCGGEFTGLFKKECAKCGRKKDY